MVIGFTEGEGRLTAYADGDVVFEEGDLGEKLYLVLSGTVRIRKESDLVATVLGEIGAGEMFGEMALLDSKPHSATAIAVGPTELAVYDKASFLASLRADPELALRVIESLARRLRATNEQLLGVCTQHVLDRTEMELIQKAVLETEL